MDIDMPVKSSKLVEPSALQWAKANKFSAGLIVLIVVTGLGLLWPANTSHSARAYASYRLPKPVAYCLPAPNYKFRGVKVLILRDQVRAISFYGKWVKNPLS